MNMEMIDLLRKISSRLGWILFILLLPFLWLAFLALGALGFIAATV